MKAIILAAGKGTRLKPLTFNMPKCMIPIANKPLIEHQINWFKKNGITEIAINLHYLSEKITSYLGDGFNFGVKISYSDETEKIMGTAGGVKKLQEFFDEDFLVFYGDEYTNLNLIELKKYHDSKTSFVTICVRDKKDKKPSNIIRLNENNRIINFIEKPDKPVSPNLANCGIYLCKKDLLNYIPDNKFFDFAYDVFPQLVKKENVYGYIIPEKYYWCEMGKLEKYEKHKKEIESMILP